MELQPTSLDIWDQKYALKDHGGKPVDLEVSDTYRRVAKALASVEKEPSKWEDLFYQAFIDGAVCGGRIMANLGAGALKSSTSAINCVVSESIGDSIRGIFSQVERAAISLSAGCGIGYDFTSLRPRGAFVAGVGASTAGALSFMDVFDSMCFTISSAGGRRGAQMGVLDIRHPDVPEFIRAKRTDGRLRQFNLSLLVTDRFMETLKEDGEWEFIFPLNKRESREGAELLWREWPYREDCYAEVDGDLVLCKVYGRMKASDLWEAVMRSTYDFAEPGFILIDQVNRMNNLSFCEKIRSTNPCGEQPLPPNGSCLLGSINLTKLVENPFTPEAAFNFKKFKGLVRLFSRMLDNVVELNGLPLPEQREELVRTRRHGMGFFGLGSAMVMLRMKYGSQDSVDFAGLVAHNLAIESYCAGIELAKEKGPAPICLEEFQTPQGKFTGAQLIARSRYLQKLLPAAKLEAVEKHGLRYTHAVSIAPTGTISLSFGNNASNGIEPSFAHHYNRNVIRKGRTTKEKVDVYSYEALLFKSMFPEEPLPDYFLDSGTIDPKDHLRVQAVVQVWVDSAISKTINVPTDYPFEEFKGLYQQAYENGLKGCTTFRFNPTAFQGVLVRPEELKTTLYNFRLSDGSTVTLRGDEEVEYEGQAHTAANLFDAIKEGYYGRL